MIITWILKDFIWSVQTVQAHISNPTLQFFLDSKSWLLEHNRDCDYPYDGRPLYRKAHDDNCDGHDDDDKDDDDDDEDDCALESYETAKRSRKANSIHVREKSDAFVLRKCIPLLFRNVN